VLQKKQVGIWMYGSCVWLGETIPYLLDFKAHTEIAALGEHVPVSSVVQRWAELVRE
jgi:hypothetical protein